MTDTTDDIAEGISFQAFEDDCRLLGSLLHDVLLRELGPHFIKLFERNRILAQVSGPRISTDRSNAAPVPAARIPLFICDYTYMLCEF